MWHKNTVVENTECAVPEKIHTHPTEGHRNFLGGGGVLKVKILEAKYEAKLEFPRGSGGAKQKTFRGGSMDIFWNCTIRGHIQNEENSKEENQRSLLGKNNL